MKMFSPWSACILSLTVVAVLLSGCINRSRTVATPPGTPAVAGTAPVQAEPRFRVREDATPFYRYGPQQAGGPDLSLKKGSDVLMLKRAFGYSQVKVVDTQQIGFIGTQDISPLTQQELVALQPPVSSLPVQSVGGPNKRSRAIVGEYNLPPAGAGGVNSPSGLGGQDSLPMPAENTPTPPPTNMFRY